MKHYSDKDDHPEADLLPAWEQISERAYELWNARGCPEGSPETDWLQAEAELKREASLHVPIRGVLKESGAVQA